MSLTPDQLITGLRLEPHPEGGWYRELHRADGLVQRSGDGAQRAGLTVIAFLLIAGERSRWHRLRQSEEIWHHGGGAPLELHRLPPQGGEAQRLALGPLLQPGSAQQPLQIIPAGWWQAARSRGAWSLAYCSVGPGFDFADFVLMADLPLELRPRSADPDLL